MVLERKIFPLVPREKSNNSLQLSLKHQPLNCLRL